jgi:hypothetical protein
VADHKAFQLFLIPETRRRILLTLGILLAYRFGFQIPLPGMNPEFLTRNAPGLAGEVFGLMNAFSDTWYVAPSKNEAERFLRLWREPFGEVLKLKGKRVVNNVERM